MNRRTLLKSLLACIPGAAFLQACCRGPMPPDLQRIQPATPHLTNNEILAEVFSGIHYVEGITFHITCVAPTLGFPGVMVPMYRRLDVDGNTLSLLNLSIVPCMVNENKVEFPFTLEELDRPDLKQVAANKRDSLLKELAYAKGWSS